MDDVLKMGPEFFLIMAMGVAAAIYIAVHLLYFAAWTLQTVWRKLGKR